MANTKEDNLEDLNAPETEETQTMSIIEKANQSASRIEAANRKREELLNRQEMVLARQMLSGKTEAGMPAEKKEESDAEYARRLISKPYGDVKFETPE